MRRLIVLTCVPFALLGAGTAVAASTFYIRGGGDGHGIGMSQYGAYGYALHGKSYRWILGHYYEGTSIGQTDPHQVVRVLIASGPAAFSGATRAGGKRLNPNLTYSVRALTNGQLAVTGPGNRKVGTFSAPLRATGPGPLDLGGHGSYRGALEFRPVGSGGVQTVDAVGLDDYVRGVISAEMPSSWSAEALKAQAVAARTYAITTDVAGNGYQLYPDTRSQMYQGVAAETPSTDAAVASTRGQVVTYHGQPVVTYFFSSSGGHTENIENVWLGAGPEPWLRGVADPYDSVADNPDYRWTDNLSMSAAAQRLGSLVKGKLVGIKVTKRGVSPRVVRAQVVGTHGRTNVTGPQLQQIFGLMSTYMSFSTISSSSGSGSGSAGTSSPGGGSTSGGAAPGASHIAMQSALAGAEAGFEVVPPPPPTLHGQVFPVTGPGTARLQSLVRGRWRPAGLVHLGANGAYTVPLRRGGLYRIVWQGLDGPAITVR